MAWSDHVSTHNAEIENPYRSCRACNTARSLSDLKSLVSLPLGADLSTMLSGRVICRDEVVCLERARELGASSRYLMMAVMPGTPSESYTAGGLICLITDNPRRAEEYAATIGGVTAKLMIHSDYRE